MLVPRLAAAFDADLLSLDTAIPLGLPEIADPPSLLSRRIERGPASPSNQGASLPLAPVAGGYQKTHPGVGWYRLTAPMRETIDVDFDFRSDTPPGRDPDTFSRTLSTYHCLLWSKPLPTGAPFNLDISGPPYYFHHASDLGAFCLSSDAVVPTFSRAREMVDIMSQLPVEETDEFNRLGYTMGGMMVFPANQIGRKMTINGARGCHPRIRDRFDLTVDCVRRHYVGESNPLSETLARYIDFFALFGNFAGYVDFFLLQDLVDEATSMVKFFTPFEDFKSSPLPRSLAAYLAYREAAMAFLAARNHRIATLMNGHSTVGRSQP
jgi:hypothetical protein